MSEVGIHKKGEINFPELLKNFEKKLGKKDGAIGSFIGIVRGEGKKGGKVKQLHYESSENAPEELKKIGDDLEKLDGITQVTIHHLVDDLEPGEEILYVLVSGHHRSEVFKALPEIMDRLKSEVKIWKKEITEDEEYWLHEVEE